MRLNGGKFNMHVLPASLFSNLDFDPELGGCAQQVDVRLLACLHLLVLPLLRGLGLLASNGEPGVQSDSTESTEKRSSSRDHGSDNRDVEHVRKSGHHRPRALSGEDG